MSACKPDSLDDALCPEKMDEPTIIRRNFNRIARMAARQFDAAIGLVSVADGRRQTLLGAYGSSTLETDRHLAFCAGLRVEDGILVVPDTLEDARFRDSPLVKGDPAIRFYAGAPLKAAGGRKAGALCILDIKPHKSATAAQRALLSDLADIAAGLVKMRPVIAADSEDTEKERRLSIAQLSIAQQQLCLFLEYAPAPIAMFNCDMEYLAATQKWRDIFRLGDKDIFGHSHYEMVPDIPAHWKSEYDRCLAGQAVKREEDRYERADGTVDWLRREMRPWFDVNGAVGGIMVFDEIITGRKRAADDLERSQRILNAIVECVQDGIIACDTDGSLFVFNSAARQIHGADAKAILPDEWAAYYGLYNAHGKTLIKKEQIPLFRALHGEVVEDEEVVVAPGGKPPRRIIVNSQPLTVRSGARIGAVASLHDITERREIEAQYFQAQKLEAIGQLTGGLAHDFNNLLAVILGNLQLLQRSPEIHGKLAHRVNAALSATQRGAELTNRLLAFARRQPLVAKPVDPNSIITGVGNLLSPTLGETVRVKIFLQDDVWPIFVDDSQLESAILNMAINARDAMEKGGQLTISTRNITFDDEFRSHEIGLTAGDYVLISISDDGTGMSNDIRAKAFEPFFTTKNVGKGSGLGLSTVYGFVQQSGGHIEIDSEQDRGTTIKMYLPRSFTHPAESAEPAGLPEEKASGPKRILVVEDDPAVREVAVALLQDLGYETAEAASGQEALEILKASGGRFDLVFTDIVMPGNLNGPALAKAAREMLPNIKVLCTSGYFESAAIQDCKSCSGVGVVRKPFRREDVERKVRLTLERDRE